MQFFVLFHLTQKRKMGRMVYRCIKCGKFVKIHFAKWQPVCGKWYYCKSCGFTESIIEEPWLKSIQCDWK